MKNNKISGLEINEIPGKPGECGKYEITPIIKNITDHNKCFKNSIRVSYKNPRLSWDLICTFEYRFFLTKLEEEKEMLKIIAEKCPHLQIFVPDFERSILEHSENLGNTALESGEYFKYGSNICQVLNNPDKIFESSPVFSFSKYIDRNPEFAHYKIVKGMDFKLDMDFSFDLYSARLWQANQDILKNIRQYYNKPSNSIIDSVEQAMHTGSITLPWDVTQFDFYSYYVGGYASSKHSHLYLEPVVTKGNFAGDNRLNIFEEDGITRGSSLILKYNDNDVQFFTAFNFALTVKVENLDDLPIIPNLLQLKPTPSLDKMHTNFNLYAQINQYLPVMEILPGTYQKKDAWTFFQIYEFQQKWWTVEPLPTQRDLLQKKVDELMAYPQDFTDINSHEEGGETEDSFEDEE